MDIESVMVWIWLGITILAIIVEIATPELVSLWFAIGGIVGIAFSFIPGLPWWGEVIIFAAVSLILLLSLRPVLNKYLKRKTLKTNVDGMIGREIRILTQADFDNLGTAKIGDVVWNVKSKDESSLLKDEIVRIVEVDGNKLIAEHIEQPSDNADIE